jgi:hypothetical protein
MRKMIRVLIMPASGNMLGFRSIETAGIGGMIATELSWILESTIRRSLVRDQASEARVGHRGHGDTPEKTAGIGPFVGDSRLNGSRDGDILPLTLLSRWTRSC